MQEMLLDARQEALVVETALNDTYDMQQEGERTCARDFITYLATSGYLSSEGIVQGVKVRARGRPQPSVRTPRTARPAIRAFRLHRLARQSAVLWQS